MIQRIQSLYLLLTSVLSALFLSGSFLRFFNNSGAKIVLNFDGIWQSALEGGRELIQGQILLSVIMILIVLISLTAIFLFKNRKLQMKLAKALIIISAASIFLIVFYAFLVSAKYQADIALCIRMFLPLLILLFSVLAFRGIRKDENLVKSYDRLR
jgi:Ca2+/Na+ antiporter